MQIDGSVRMVFLQFSFGNKDLVPSWAFLLSQEKLRERTARKSLPPSVPFIPPTPNCEVVNFVDDLERAGYELVTALCQERIDPHDHAKTYWMARFGFARHNVAQVSDGYRAFLGEIRADLLKLATDAFWRVRAYRNPFWQNEEQLDGQFAVSVNFEARQVRFDGNGLPVVARKRDDHGRKVGNPVPIEPDAHLRILSDDVMGIMAMGLVPVRVALVS